MEKKEIFDGIAVLSLMFSPDSQHLSYVAKQAIDLCDCGRKEGQSYDGIREGTFIFSHDSQHVAYGAQRGDKVFVVVEVTRDKDTMI